MSAAAATEFKVIAGRVINHMTQKRKTSEKATKSGFKDAVRRLIQSVPQDIADVNQRVARDAEEIERDAAKQFRDIQSGGRDFKRPFRP